MTITTSSPGPKDINKMSVPAAKIKGNSSYAGSQEWIKGLFDHFHPRGKCINAVKKVSWVLYHVSYQYKTQEMCIRAVEEDPYSLKYVPDHFKTQGMCTEAVDIEPFLLYVVPDPFKTKKMCKKQLGKTHQA